jgi:hypothetical protein
MKIPIKKLRSWWGSVWRTDVFEQRHHVHFRRLTLDAWPSRAVPAAPPVRHRWNTQIESLQTKHCLHHKSSHKNGKESAPFNGTRCRNCRSEQVDGVDSRGGELLYIFQVEMFVFVASIYWWSMCELEMREDSIGIVAGWLIMPWWCCLIRWRRHV